MNGSLKLSEYRGDMVRLSCEKCGRSGQYRKQKLIEDNVAGRYRDQRAVVHEETLTPMRLP
jgi:hypothetical protein